LAKFVPEIITDVPATPKPGDKEVTLGVGITVNGTPLLVEPSTLTVTFTFPPGAFAGTVAVTEVSLQLLGVAAPPPNETVVESNWSPRFAPVIVTLVPAGPELGEMADIVGVAKTIKFELAMAPFTSTARDPVVAPLGTVTTIWASAQLFTVADCPLNVTVLRPCDAPKYEPSIQTVAPTAAEDGLSEMIDGGKLSKTCAVVKKDW
jgi:hypothetical protein